MNNLDKPFHLIFTVYPAIFAFAVLLMIYFFVKEIRKNGDKNDK